MIGTTNKSNSAPEVRKYFKIAIMHSTSDTTAVVQLVGDNFLYHKYDDSLVDRGGGGGRKNSKIRESETNLASIARKLTSSLPYKIEE